MAFGSIEPETVTAFAQHRKSNLSMAFTSIEPKTATPLSAQWIDLRLTAAIRLMLVAAALLVVIIDPPASGSQQLSYLVLGIYTIYSATILIASIHRRNLVPVQLMHWIDMGWYQLIIYFSGAENLFFVFFFFAILVASFGFGYKAGLRLTLTTAAIFALLGMGTSIQGGASQLNRVLLRTVELIVLGFMISHWGGFRISLRNRLQLLKDVVDLSNSRFGTDRTINSILESVREFFGADACLLLIKPNSDATDFQMYHMKRGSASTGSSPPVVSSEAASLFVLPSPNHAMIYRKGHNKLSKLIDLDVPGSKVADPAIAERLANALEATSYLSVPVRYRNQPIGRLFIVGGPEDYDHSAVDFVSQLLDHVTPLIQNIRLIDSLASYSSEEERRRIARDIHDSVIQPYIGLQLGIAAVAQKLRAGNTDVVNNMEELLELTNQELTALRGYVVGLRAGEERRDVLMPSIERFVSRFSTVTGISVSVTAKGKINVNDRLAAEIFQMVTEGLSNVRRHALCNDASVELACHKGKLLLQIKNPRPNHNGNGKSTNAADKNLFTPRSISERASLLGGKTQVSIDEQNRTVVQVAIPL